MSLSEPGINSRQRQSGDKSPHSKFKRNTPPRERPPKNKIRSRNLSLFLIFLPLVCALCGCRGERPGEDYQGAVIQKLNDIAVEARSHYNKSIKRHEKTPDSEELRRQTIGWFIEKVKEVQSIRKGLATAGELDVQQGKNLFSSCLTTENLILSTKEAYRRLSSFDKAEGEEHLTLAKNYLKILKQTSNVVQKGTGRSQPENVAVKKEYPNVLFVLIDAVRADHLSCYGYERRTTPIIDQIASEGILFENAFAQAPHTTSSMASVFTGLYPGHHGLINHYRWKKWKSDKNLIAGFKQAGYRTAAFSANTLVSDRTGFGAGFDDFVTRGWTTADVINNEVYRWLSNYSRDNPYFIYVHYMDPHDTYNAPGGFDNIYDPHFPRLTTAFWIQDVLEDEIAFDFDPDAAGWFTTSKALRLLRDQKYAAIDRRVIDNISVYYDGEIRFADGMLGKLLRVFNGKGLLENTIIIIASDHGEGFLEHGFMRHSRTLYDEMLHVPLILWDGGKRFKPRRIEQQVELAGLLPTVMSEAGLDPPADIDVKPFDLANPRSEHNSTLTYSATWYGWSFKQKKEIPKVAIRTPNYKLIYTPSVPMFEFYNLKTDPLEQVNLAAVSETAIPEDARRKLISFNSRIKWTDEEDEKDTDPALLEKLKTLGYIK